jgi:hypothetical protein
LKVEKGAVCSDGLKVVLMVQRLVDRMADSKALRLVEWRGQLKVLPMAAEWAAMWVVRMVGRKDHKLVHLLVGLWVVPMAGGSDFQKVSCLAASKVRL